jgi:deoxycytidylate deaminase
LVSIATHACPQNAFNTKLGRFGFDFHSILAPDLMHDVELGVFKALLTHLIRILHAEGNALVQELNRQ